MSALSDSMPAVFRLLGARVRWLCSDEEDIDSWSLRSLAIAAAGSVAGLTLLAAIARQHFPIVLFVLGIPLLVAAFFHPLLGAASALLLAQTYDWVTIGPDISLFQPLVAVSVLGLLVRRRRESFQFLRRASRSLPVLAATALLAWILLAAFVVGPTPGALRHNLQYIRDFVGSLIFLLLILAVARDDRARAILLGAVVIGAVANALVGFAQVFTSQALVSAWVLPSLRPVQHVYSRLAAPWGLAAAPINFARTEVVGMAILLPVVVRLRAPKLRGLLLACLAVVTVALMLSGSRAGWIAGVAVCALVVWDHRSRLTVAVAAAGASLLIACLVHPALPSELQPGLGAPGNTVAQHSSPRGNHKGTGSSASSQNAAAASQIAGVRNEDSLTASNGLRTELISAGLRMAADHPVFGVGPGAFQDHLNGYLPAPNLHKVIDPRRNVPAHNVLLEIWDDSGTPALLAFLVFYVAALLLAWRARSRGNAIHAGLAAGTAAALVAMFVISMFHNYQYDKSLWAFAGLACSFAVFSLADDRVTDRPPIRRVLRAGRRAVATESTRTGV